MPSAKSTALVTKKPAPLAKATPEVMAALVIKGDLAGLSLESKTTYYVAMAQACGLNPATRPFEFLELNGRTVLYVKKEATDQLRLLKKVSLKVVRREKDGEVYLVEVKASTPDGRVDFATGAVSLGKKWDKKSQDYTQIQSPDDLANSMMRAETKAKRRATLSICGLGCLDESELDTLPKASPLIDEPTRERIIDLGVQKEQETGKDVLGENLKAFKVDSVCNLTMEQAGSILGLMED
jgi:hypothetical protein